MGPTLGTVERTVTIMRAIACTDGEASLKAIADSVGLPRSTVHRLLGLLSDVGVVEQNLHTNGYKAGPELYRIAARVVSNYSVQDIAEPFLKRLVERVGETCLLLRYIRSSNEVLLEHYADGPSQLRYFFRFSQPLSLVWGAPGRSILAHLPGPEIDQVLSCAHPKSLSDEPLPSHEQMRNLLNEIKEAGYARSSGHQVDGAVGFAAPVFMNGKSVFGSICVTIPQHRFTADMEPKITASLREEAAALSAALGHVQPHHAPTGEIEL